MRRSIALLTVLIGCSSSSSTTTTPSGDAATESGVFDYCKETEAREKKCGDTFNAAECSAQLTCLTTVMRPADREELLRCFATRECTESDDSCVAEVSMKYGSDTAVTAYTKACLEKRTACSGSFTDDICGADYGMFNDTVRAQLKACIEKPCAEVFDCYIGVLDANGCGK